MTKEKLENIILKKIIDKIGTDLEEISENEFMCINFSFRKLKKDNYKIDIFIEYRKNFFWSNEDCMTYFFNISKTNMLQMYVFIKNMVENIALQYDINKIKY